MVTGIHKNTPKDFVLGVKLNPAGFIDRKAVLSSDEKVLQHVGGVFSWELFDFLEISGDYENPSRWTPFRECRRGLLC